MFDKILPYLLSGISVGGQYALIAVGYTMVYGILRLINFAHGDIFTAAGFFMVYIAATLPVQIAIPLVVVLTVILGFAVERVAYKPLRSAPRMSVMISAIGVSYLLQNLMWYVTGGLAKQYPTIPWISNSITIGPATTKVVTIVTPILTILLVIALVTIIQKTKIGMAMRAVSKDFETAQLMGIKIDSVISTTFIIGSLLAAVGSVLYFSNYTSVTPTVGAMPGLKAFVAAVFGGIGSIPGAVIGAFIIGICENLIKALGYTTFSDAFTFALLIVILLFKPTGLFGEKISEKVWVKRHEEIDEKPHQHRPSDCDVRGAVLHREGRGHEIDADHGAQKGRNLRPDRRLHEPAQRLYRPVLPGSGGLHAGGRVHLRRADHPHGQAHGGVPVL